MRQKTKLPGQKTEKITDIVNDRVRDREVKRQKQRKRIGSIGGERKRQKLSHLD
jgi:hypothetical protein